MSGLRRVWHNGQWKTAKLVRVQWGKAEVLLYDPVSKSWSITEFFPLYEVQEVRCAIIVKRRVVQEELPVARVPMRKRPVKSS